MPFDINHHLACVAKQVLQYADKAHFAKSVNAPKAPGASGPNKKSRLLAKVSSGLLGHEWEVISKEGSNNMTIKCKKCTLFMQQTDRPDKFTRLEAHPCVGVSADPGFFTGLHVSHELFNLGYAWVCRVCGGVLKPGAEATPQALQRQCKTRTKPTQAIQASRPLAHQARAQRPP